MNENLERVRMDRDLAIKQTATRLANIYTDNMVHTMDGYTAVTQEVLTRILNLFAQVPDADKADTYVYFANELDARGVKYIPMN